MWWHDEMNPAQGTCEPEWLDAEDPLFMLYTRFVLLRIRLVHLCLHLESQALGSIRDPGCLLTARS